MGGADATTDATEPVAEKAPPEWEAPPPTRPAPEVALDPPAPAILPPTSPAPATLLLPNLDVGPSGSAAPADEPPVEVGEETAEEHGRRIEWIRYYVSVGKLQQAFDIGWDGKPWNEQAGEGGVS